MAAALELDGSAQAVLIAEEPFADGAVVEALYTEDPTPPVCRGWRAAT